MATDFLVFGSGIAGLRYALEVAEYGRVVVVTKGEACESATQYAQGGVAAVLSPLDSVAHHVADTLKAGAFLNDGAAVRAVCEEGPARVLELAELGAQFTRERDGTLHLAREGGHSHPRIAHHADASGAAIEAALLARARAHGNIRLVEHCVGLDLVTQEVAGGAVCTGALVYDAAAGTARHIAAKATMLATGGAGHVYPHTTNPGVITGDGVAMAYRAGAEIANMEFVQFHPTGLYEGAQSSGMAFLISEAVRGAGGVLLNLGGERFMPAYDERAELAPRDVVARSIYDQMQTRGEPHVLLDISHEERGAVLEHFPTIASRCLSRGIDITVDPIPVLPVQHYFCGGVKTSLSGETSIQGLYACGEVAHTGLHGANRLASNSLLEGLVFSHRATVPSLQHAEFAPSEVTAREVGIEVRKATPQELLYLSRVRHRIQSIMWQHAGIIRTCAGLEEARLDLLEVEDALVHWNGERRDLWSRVIEEVEAQNLLTVAKLVIDSALRRKESRGLHYNLDFPAAQASEKQDTVLSRRLRGGPVTQAQAQARI